MAKSNPLFQRQLLSTRQMLTAIAVLACLAYIILYSGRVVAGVRAQRKLVELQKTVAEREAFRQEVETLLEHVDDPAVIDAYAREERNWVKPGDQPVAPIIRDAPIDPQPAPEPRIQQTRPEPNWRLWWKLLGYE
ncbi:MAG: hypothetical protein GXP42_13285 [Chloroflexi bacterium]|nr:hypothetical protein [Chloroflexota bacterium]